MILSLYYLQTYYIKEIIRGQNSFGTYHIHPQFKSVNCPQALPDAHSSCSPDAIVERIKSKYGTPISMPVEQNEATKIPLSQTERAHRLINEGKISFDPKLHTFTILGTGDKPQVVKLHPKETCTCPSTVTCYHIIAAKISISITESNRSGRKQINLTQLRRNARKRREKKSGHKKPRPGDVDVIPAPDASQGKMHFIF